MKTQIISYCANTKSFSTGIDILNANSQRSDVILTFKNKEGITVKVKPLNIKPWAHVTFKPKITGRFSMIAESPENIIITRVLSSTKGGLSECYAV